MADFDKDMAQSLRDAGRAFDIYTASLQIYQAKLVQRDWDGAEAERENIHAALDDYLDHTAAAHRRAQIEANSKA